MKRLGAGAPGPLDLPQIPAEVSSIRHENTLCQPPLRPLRFPCGILPCYPARCH
jgi:hypothetical protein